MQLARERLEWNRVRALRAGFLAFALAQLLVAVIATPWLATHSEVAHAHAPETEPHIHPLADLFAAGPVAAPVRRIDVDHGALTAAAPIAYRTAPSSPPSVDNGARSPPAPPA